MKVFAAVVPLLLSSLVSASWFSSEQAAIQEEPLPVPGENPLLYCANPKDYILSIDHIDLSPNPPSPGTKLSITANGTLSETVEEGAKVHLEVKWGLVRILTQTVDLCEQAGNVDLECPIEKGALKLTKEVDLPKEIPPGKYTVLADVLTKDGDKITCLTASIIFKRGAAAEFVDL